MIFRCARHTADLQKIEEFYTKIVGLEHLGGFKNHSNYDGLFLGPKNAAWHLEFTTSPDKPKSQFDEDDILVFYVHSDIELTKIRELLKQKNINQVIPKNPYWVENGIMIEDPDGYRVVFSLSERTLTARDELTNLVKNQGVKTWSDLIEFVRSLPYGRNENRSDLSLVIRENKGTCSSKHALIKKIADQNNFEDVTLIMAIYKMNQLNTPKIGDTLQKNGLAYIPEAHCYLKLNNRRIDITNNDSDIDLLWDDLLEEIEIEADEVNTYKVNYHKKYLKNWIESTNLNFDFDRIWAIRERCIRQLEQK
jgi:hypothetical protein